MDDNVEEGSRADFPNVSEDTDSDVGTKKAIRKTVTITKDRLVHKITEHTLSISALKKLLKRARCANLKQATDWYREMLQPCGCSLAEYARQHRPPLPQGLSIWSRAWGGFV